MRIDLVTLVALLGGCHAFVFPFNTFHITPDITGITNEMSEEPIELWFDQKLNHYDQNDNRTFKQRYFMNTTFYKPGGPVLLLIEGEGEASSHWVKVGPISQTYAKQYNALFVNLEHRFFGKSVPNNDLSIENLQYLSSRIALRDIAEFVKHLTKQMSLEKSKWIAFGGSYPGSLAAHVRSKYPDLIAGAFASSAPMEAVFNFTQYYVTVGEILGSECSQQISQATQQIEEQLKSSAGVDKISKMFNVCGKFNVSKDQDIAQFFGHLMSNIQISEVFLDLYPTLVKPKVICDIMTNTSDGSLAMERYAKAMSMFNQSCVDTDYQAYIESMQTTNRDFAGIQMRPWTYVCCNEWGFPNTEAKNQPFGHRQTLEMSMAVCKEVYGAKYTLEYIKDSLDLTNQYYGTRDTINITNTVFINNLLDPTIAFSIRKPLNNKTFVVEIPGTGHGADMIPLKPNAPNELVKAQQFIAHQIGVFLNDD